MCKLTAMTRDQLRQECRTLGIRRYSTMNNDAMRDAIRGAILIREQLTTAVYSDRTDSIESSLQADLEVLQSGVALEDLTLGALTVTSIDVEDVPHTTIAARLAKAIQSLDGPKPSPRHRGRTRRVPSRLRTSARRIRYAERAAEREAAAAEQRC